LLKPEAITALELRRSGADLRHIAIQLKTTPHKASRLIQSALEVLYSPREQSIDDMRGLETARLDMYLLRMSNAILAGDTNAIQTAVRISERLAKIWGLDSPSKISPVEPDGVTPYRQVSGLSEDELMTRIIQVLSRGNGKAKELLLAAVAKELAGA